MTDEDRPDPASPLPENNLEVPTDAELIAQVRDGDQSAFEELFLRHRDIALRYARRIAGAERADDLCAEAFTKILDLLQRGKGPDVAFRAYLLTTVRTSHLNNVRAGSREELVPDPEPAGRSRSVTEDPDARFDRDAIFRAFSTLPERWQAALWLTAVEGHSNEEVGRRLSINANAVASLAFRARTGLRHAYLTEHLLDGAAPACRRVLELLPAYLGGRLSSRRQDEVDQHLPGCASCTAAVLELTEVGARLGMLLAPLGLTAATAASMAPVTAGNLGAMSGSLKAVLAGATTHLKGWASTTPWAATGKVVVAASVAATGAAFGAHALTKHPATRPETGVHGPVTQTTGGSPVSPDPTGSLTPGQTPSLTPGVTPTGAPTGLPTGATTATTSPSTSESPTGTTAPTEPSPSSDPTTPDPPAARSMSISEMSSSTVRRSVLPWDRVTVALDGVVEGALVRLTSTRTYKVDLVGGAGWTCGQPTIARKSGQPWGTSTTVCKYTAKSGSGTLQIDYQVTRSAAASATLTPPAGFDDSSSSDNSGSTSLAY